MEFFKRYKWPLLSGLLVGFSYIPLPGFFVLFCYSPLWFFARQETNLKRLFWGGWWTQFLLSLIGFHWIAFTAREYGGFPIWFSVTVLFAFATFVHTYIPLSLVAFGWLRRKWPWAAPLPLLTLPLLHSLAERLWPSLFPWHLGYTTLWNQWPMYQLSDLIGFEGISTLLLIFNGYWLWMLARPTGRKKAGALAAGLGALALLNALGAWHRPPKSSQLQSGANPPPLLKVLIVQANIDNADKILAEQGRGNYQQEITNRFLRLTEAGLAAHPDTQLVVWPETAYADYLDNFRMNGYHQQTLAKFFVDRNIALFTGSYSVDPPNLKRRKSYNGAALLSPQMPTQTNMYHKTHLLMFGEYLPFAETFPILETWLPFIAGFGTGSGPIAMPLATSDLRANLGPQICYEGLYPDFSRGLVKAGVDLIVNLTNDSWFTLSPWYWRPFEPEQHLYMTLARAIEVRRPLLRSTNTGVSMGILADGELLPRSPIRQEWFGQYSIPLPANPPLTFFARWGQWDLLMWGLIFAIFVWQSRPNERIQK